MTDPAGGRPLVDASTDCIKVIGKDGRLIGMNPDGLCIMEIDDFEPLRGAQWSMLWPEASRELVEQAVARATSGSVARFAAACPTAKGTPKHWEVMVSPVYGDDGRVAHLLSVSRDVTRELLADTERRLVARELSHRIANLFAVVDGLISLSARSATSAPSLAQSLRERVSGLGRAIAYIYSSGTPDRAGTVGTLHGLLGDVLSPFAINSAETAIAITGEDHAIAESAVTSLALVFNELGTNALKYGALAAVGGVVRIHTTIGADALLISWSEHGGAIDRHVGTAGFGTTLLDRTVRSQLGGSLHRRWEPHGLHVELSLPLSQLG